MSTKPLPEATNFIQSIINQDILDEKVQTIQTRFPPEPNGYLHIGHAKSMFVNFGTAKLYRGKCNLFFDDTNPSKEKEEYVNSIKKDIQWLGYNWQKECYASDFFDKIYQYAIQLIQMNKAYVCNLSPEEIKNTRGTLTEKGQDSPYRTRTVDENLQLFEEMRLGKFKEGSCCLRAKIDMASPNLNLRDPVIYRISYDRHYRTGNKWCIYPMYDFAHPICDYLQNVTHSICTLEFEDHRPLYDWVGITLNFVAKPKQIEFARLGMTNTVMSKRYLKKLVEDGTVHNWDDPRMPTLSGMRNRGIPPEAILDFCQRIGISKSQAECEYSYFEACIREYLNYHAERTNVIVKPLKLTITNYEGEEEVDFDINPMQTDKGKRKRRFSKTIYIEQDDFSIEPPPKYYRLKPNGYVRLKDAYIVRCDGFIQDKMGNVTEVLCTYFKESKSGQDKSGIKTKGVIHWVSEADAMPIELVQYQLLLQDARYEGQDFQERINYNSEQIKKVFAEKYILSLSENTVMQCLRTGYYKTDNHQGKLRLTEVVSLKESFKSK